MYLRPTYTTIGFVRNNLLESRRRLSVIPNNMAATEKGDHLSITTDSFRQEAIAQATIKLVENLSPTVKKLTLIPQQPKELFFKAGQWVDFFIPTVTTVGGFSMCSAPQVLLEEGKFELAVKYSEHPPAKWVHTRCRAGDAVGVKVGGNFFFDPSSFSTSSSGEAETPFLFLVAGGVGINPILSILEEFSANVTNGTIPSNSKATLLYSAASREELLFKDRIDLIVDRTPGVSVKYFVTRERPEVTTIDLKTAFILRRIEESDLRKNLSSYSLDSSELSTYLCGPPAMIDGLVNLLKEVGVADDERLHYEKWW